MKMKLLVIVVVSIVIAAATVNATEVECKDMANLGCEREPQSACDSQEEKRIFCPKSCNACKDKCADASADVQFNYGRRGTCALDKDLCSSDETVQRLCPVTCNICPDDTTLKPQPACFKIDEAYTKDFQTIKNIPNPAECGRICQESTDCYAWSYVTDTFSPSSYRRNCDLQNSEYWWTNASMSLDGLISGLKTCPDGCKDYIEGCEQKIDECGANNKTRNVCPLTCGVCTVETTEVPTQAPTKPATQAPTKAQTQAPTKAPTQAPTKEPTQAPTKVPTQAPIVDCYTPYPKGYNPAKFMQYRGSKNETKGGFICQAWNATEPNNGNPNSKKDSHYPDIEMILPDGTPKTSVNAAGNKCRNPDSSAMPWCYIAACGADQCRSVRLPRWQYCDIPKCTVSPK